MKLYNEGKLYGGIALIIIGIIMFVENKESLFFDIVLSFIGVVLVIFGFKRDNK